MDPEYLAAALEAGFNEKQAQFLLETFAFDPHEHTADQIFMDDDEQETLADWASEGAD